VGVYVCQHDTLEPFEMSPSKFYGSKMVKSSVEFENGCILMQCGARVVFNVSAVLVYVFIRK